MVLPIIWQLDFYRRPLQNERGDQLWELLVCDRERTFAYIAFCSQAEVSSNWIIDQLQKMGRKLPDIIQVFRPQTMNLLESTAEILGVKIEGTRRTKTLKKWLEERSIIYPQMPGYTGQNYNPIAIDKPPPLPLPDNLWGDQWRFASLPAGEVTEIMLDRPIPILVMPEDLLPLNLGLSSQAIIPGIVIDGGRKSRYLAQWLQEIKPVELNYIAGEPDGLVLETGLIDRWIIATFNDPEVTQAAKLYGERKKDTLGLHFLLVQPDDSGMTYSGFWLLLG